MRISCCLVFHWLLACLGFSAPMLAAIPSMEWVDLSNDQAAEQQSCAESCNRTQFAFLPYEHDKVPAGFQKTILFKTSLPPQLAPGDVLYFPNGLETIAVYINGQKRYQHGEFTRSLMQVDPQVWHIVDLKPEDAGAEVLIKTYYAIGYMVKNFRPVLKSGEKIRAELIETSMQTVGFAGFFATLALLFVPVVMTRRKFDSYAYFFSFLVAAVAWLLMNQDSVVKPYLPIRRELWPLLDIGGAFVACPSLLMMLTDIASFKSKILPRFILASAVVYAFSVTSHLLGVLHIWYGAMAMQVGTALPLLVLVPRLLYLAAHGNRESKLLILGVVSAAVGIFHDILRYADFWRSPFVSLAPAGAVILILSFVLILVRRYQHEKNEAFRTQNKLLKDIQTLNNQLEKHIEHVEGIVDERTKDIRSILQSIEEGIFTFEMEEGGGIILGREMSRFGRQEFLQLQDKDQTEFLLLLGALGLSQEECSMVEGIILSSLGEGEVTFELNVGNLPRHLHSRNGRALEVDWLPVLGQADGAGEGQVIKKILLSVRDVTEREKMREVARRKDLESEMMLEIIVLGRLKALQGVAGLTSIFAMAREETLDRSEASHEEKTIFVKRALHTAKGFARSFGFQKLSLKIHELEGALIEGAIGDDAAFNLGESAARSYETMTYKIYEPSHSSEGADLEAEATRKRMELIVQEIMTEAEVGTEFERRQIVKALERAMRLSEGKKLLKHILAPLDAEKKSLARLLDKMEPELAIDDGAAFAANEGVSLRLLGIFLHLTRNAIDHGIESPEERIQIGKQPQGRIVIQSRLDDNALLITMFDDGRGLDIKRLARIFETMRGRRPRSDEEAAQIIFEPGISTKDAASEVSGRGVGMDAVLADVHRLGGEAGIHLGPASDAAGHRPFVLEMKFFLETGWGSAIYQAGA